MTSFDEDDILKLLTDNSQIEWQIKKVYCDFNFCSTRIKSEFFYWDFTDGRYEDSHLIDFLSRKLIYFCLGKKEISETLRKAKTHEEITSAVLELHERAKNLFIQVHKLKLQKAKTSGEPAELLLFVFLETIMKAPQIVAKMELKTNSQMPVHGADGIHVGYNDGTLSIYLGEAKLYQQCSNAVSEAFNSICSIAKDKSKKENEIRLIKSFINIEDDNLKEGILEYLDPYSTKSKNMKIIFSCFIGFDFNKYEKIQTLPPEKVKDYFEKEYKEQAKVICNYIENGVKDYNAHDIDIQFFLLPFPSVIDFRKAFYDKLGMSYDFN